MFWKAGENEPAWIAMPVDEKPPGGFPIVFSYSRQTLAFSALLILAAFAALFLVAWGTPAFPRIACILVVYSLFLLWLFLRLRQNTLEIYPDRLVLDLLQARYEDIESITVQTTRTGHPIRMAVKTAAQTIRVEGFVCMDILVRELLARAGAANEALSVTIQRGPTRFQFGLLFAALAAVGIFQLLSYLDVQLWVWALVAVVFVKGIPVILHFAYKDPRPKAFSRLRKWTRVLAALAFLIPLIIVGVMCLAFWWRILHI